MSNVLVTANSLVPSAFSLIPRPLLPSVSFPGLHHLQSHSQTITTSSLIPNSPFSFPGLFPGLQSHSQTFTTSILLLSLVSRPYPLTRRNSLVNQVKFFKKGNDTQIEMQIFTVVREVLHIITNLTISLVLTTLGISSRNSTLFTRLFLAERCAQAGHETKYPSLIPRAPLTMFQ